MRNADTSRSHSSARQCKFTMEVCGLCFVAIFAGFFAYLYLLISHDDLQSNFQASMELSNQLKTYMPIDFVWSGLFLLLTLCFSLPLSVFKVRSFLRRDYNKMPSRRWRISSKPSQSFMTFFLLDPSSCSSSLSTQPLLHRSTCPKTLPAGEP